LQRIERANPDHFRFPRETPRQQRHTPFIADQRELVELRDAVIGLIAFVGLVAALVNRAVVAFMTVQRNATVLLPHITRKAAYDRRTDGLHMTLTEWVD
jgi:Flp pilus assembly protein TadB